MVVILILTENRAGRWDASGFPRLLSVSGKRLLFSQHQVRNKKVLKIRSVNLVVRRILAGGSMRRAGNTENPSEMFWSVPESEDYRAAQTPMEDLCYT